MKSVPRTQSSVKSEHDEDVRAFLPQPVGLVASGISDPVELLTQIEPINDDVLNAYRTFDTREPGWVKVALAPVVWPTSARVSGAG